MTAPKLDRAIAAASDETRLKAAAADVLDNLGGRVREYLAEHPDEPWDAAIAGLVQDVFGEAEA